MNVYECTKCHRRIATDYATCSCGTVMTFVAVKGGSRREAKEKRHIAKAEKSAKKRSPFCEAKAEPCFGKNIPYKEYLRTKWWSLKREQKLRSTSWKCERCREPATQVHHKHYEKLWKEKNVDLESICAACHEHEHQGIIQMNRHIAAIARAR